MSTLKNLSNAQRQKLKNIFNGLQTQSKWNSYYSRVRFTATGITVTGTLASYTLAAGAQVEAFGYTRTGDMSAAGLPGTVATVADTNILTANQTIAGETVVIQGISIMALAQSDANFLKQLDQSTSVKIKLNGVTDYLLGIPSMIPACGGLFGSSEAWSVAPSLADQVSRNIGVITNGIPHSSNFFPLSEPMLWCAAGRGDSNFAIDLKIERNVATINQFGSTARAAIADYVAPYTPPTAAQTWVDYMIVLIGCTVNPLSSY
jgi:hypothetical protein